MESRLKPEPHRLPEVRRIINGCAYDTTTASVLYHWRCDDDPDWHPAGDFWGGALLINRWGAYFVLAYNWNCDPWDDDYERITPLDRCGAIKWAEQHCPFIVEELFGSWFRRGIA